MSDWIKSLRNNASIIALAISVIGGLTTISGFVLADHTRIIRVEGKQKKIDERQREHIDYIKESEAARRAAIGALSSINTKQDVIIELLNETSQDIKALEDEINRLYLLNPDIKSPKINN